MAEDASLKKDDGERARKRARKGERETKREREGGRELCLPAPLMW